jgi:hypothetical protein
LTIENGLKALEDNYKGFQRVVGKNPHKLKLVFSKKRGFSNSFNPNLSPVKGLNAVNMSLN